jgi:hypothetical protein
MACLLGENRDIFFPKLSEHLHLITFAEIAVKFLEDLNLEPHLCGSEDEARSRVNELAAVNKWPCYFFASDTTGEKDFEEFFTRDEVLDLDRFESLGIIKNDPIFEQRKILLFTQQIQSFKENNRWNRRDLIALFNEMIPDFNHKETGKFLDNKM